MKKNTLKICIDAFMLLGFLFLMEPMSTGLYLHEWAGLLICVIFIVHKAINWVWISKTTTGFFKKLPGKQRFCYILDWLILAGFTLIVVSGIKIAHLIDFSWLGVKGMSVFWRFAHTSFSFLTLILVGIHLGLHWQWILNRFKKTISQ